MAGMFVNWAKDCMLNQHRIAMIVIFFMVEY